MMKKDLASALLKKGFEEEERKHHTYYHYVTLNGARIGVRTYLSRGSKPKQLPRNLESEIAKQCYLSKAELRQLVECTIDQGAYENILEGKDLT